VSRILVIRLGALGDFVLSFGPFAAIRAQHPGAEITLLTTAPYAELARAAPWFDRVVVDARPPAWHVGGLLRLRRAVRGFDFVYDLQTSARSGWYFSLAGRPAWSGIARGCSHPHDNPGRDRMHTVERQREQLERAGITLFPPPDLTWLRTKKPSPPGRGLGEGAGHATIAAACPHPAPLPGGEGRTAVLIPGAAPHRPRKRWPAERFGTVAGVLVERGITPLVVGTASDTAQAATIRAACPSAIDLTGRTSLLQLARTMASAALAVGNDTGPTHLAAALGLPTIALFSDESDPALTRPRGDVTVLAAPDLADLPTARVVEALPAVHSSRSTVLEAL
jgi:ADP-heptose:LPS heptosyltransferase